jgi:hypothetical protein
MHQPGKLFGVFEIVMLAGKSLLPFQKVIGSMSEGCTVLYFNELYFTTDIESPKINLHKVSADLFLKMKSA